MNFPHSSEISQRYFHANKQQLSSISTSSKHLLLHLSSFTHLCVSSPFSSTYRLPSSYTITWQSKCLWQRCRLRGPQTSVRTSRSWRVSRRLSIGQIVVWRFGASSLTCCCTRIGFTWVSMWPRSWCMGCPWSGCTVGRALPLSIWLAYLPDRWAQVLSTPMSIWWALAGASMRYWPHILQIFCWISAKCAMAWGNWCESSYLVSDCVSVFFFFVVNVVINDLCTHII